MYGTGRNHGAAFLPLSLLELHTLRFHTARPLTKLQVPHHIANDMHIKPFSLAILLQSAYAFTATNSKNRVPLNMSTEMFGKIRVLYQIPSCALIQISTLFHS
jgi:hypothetical protein